MAHVLPMINSKLIYVNFDSGHAVRGELFGEDFAPEPGKAVGILLGGLGTSPCV